MSSEEVQKAVGVAIKPTEEFSEQKLDEYQKRVETQIQASAEKYDALTAQGKNAAAEVNAELQETLDDLERKDKP